jgi:hypothetical protein
MTNQTNGSGEPHPTTPTTLPKIAPAVEAAAQSAAKEAEAAAKATEAATVKAAAKAAKIAKATKKPVAVVTPIHTNGVNKPVKGNLDRFKAKRSDKPGGIPATPKALPVHSIAQAQDFVRLHPDMEKMWSDVMYVVRVPVKGQKGEKGGILHLITEDLVPKLSRKVKRIRLALAAKPDNSLFLCSIPDENMDNAYNATALRACERSAAEGFLEVVSLKAQGTEDYEINPAEDRETGGGAAPPNWPVVESIYEIIEEAFKGHMIESENDPAFKRLIGAKQNLNENDDDTK